MSIKLTLKDTKFDFVSRIFQKNSALFDDSKK